MVNNLYKESGFDKRVYEIVDNLYDDAEKAGLKGMQKAREMFRNAKDFQKHAKDAMKIEKMDEARIMTDVNAVMNDPKKHALMVDKYSNFIGKDKARRIFDDALSMRRGRGILEGAKRGAKYGALAGITALGGAMGAKNLISRTGR